jgi:hypothetical protein
MLIIIYFAGDTGFRLSEPSILIFVWHMLIIIYLAGDTAFRISEPSL